MSCARGTGLLIRPTRLRGTRDREPGTAVGRRGATRAEVSPEAGGNAMRTLPCGLRVTDLERSIAFYMAVGYEVIGSLPETGLGHLTMLKLPGDDFVTVELVHDPTAGPIELGTGLSHLVVQVESMDAAVARLATAGIDAEDPVSPDG